MEYLAKSNGITLKKHSIDVMEMSEILLKKSGINDEKLINITKIAALLHDIGKTAPFFQENINNNEELSKYPRHNEIGFALLKCLIDDNYGFYEDKKWVELIQYSTLYHHTPHNNENWFSDYFDNNNLNNISNYYNQLFTECEFSKIIRFKNNVDINEECIYIGTTKTFSFIKPDEGVKTSNLEKLKYFEIIFNIVRYADLIVSGKYEYNQFRANPNIIYDNALMPTHFDKERWDEQCDVANQAYGNNMTIVDATMGWGKTICGIMYLLHSDKKGFWVCPDNTLAQGIYKNIINDLNEIGLSNIKVSLVLGGKWENTKIEDADIIITNIDSYVNGIFRNSRKTLSYESLFSNTIFDEYHEYLTSNDPILIRFKTVIEARKLMNNVKTLLLSGTAINKGYVNVNNIIVADKTELDKKRKMHIKFIENKNELNALYQTLDDYFVINTNIKTVQDNFDLYNMNYCYHSLFDNTDLKRIINNIYEHNGKNAIKTPCNVSSTLLYSRGLNISHKSCVLINPMLFSIEQSSGRTGNRWVPEIIAQMFIHITNDPKETAIYKHKKAKKGDINIWDNFYKPFLLYIKGKVNNQTISVYNFKKLREEYAEKENLYKKIYMHNGLKSIKKLCEIEFSKGSAISEKNDNTQNIKDKPDVRGYSLNRFFIVKKDNGTISGPLNLEPYRFNSESDNFQNAFSNTRIMDEIKHYFINNDDERIRYGLKKDIKKYKNKNLMNILLDKSKSSEFPFPILCDYVYDSNKGFLKK